MPVTETPRKRKPGERLFDFGRTSDPGADRLRAAVQYHVWRCTMTAKRTRKGEVRPFPKPDIGDVLDLTDMLIELEQKDPEAFRAIAGTIKIAWDLMRATQQTKKDGPR
jgi:hypothetical protein